MAGPADIGNIVRRALQGLLAAAFFGFATLPATAQIPTSVTAIQGLSFGSLVGGLAEPVSVNEGWRRGEARLEGDRNVDVQFILPTALVSSSGATIPLQFVSGDGSITMAGTTQPKLFDPKVGTKVQFKPTASVAMMYLGGTALPAANQLAGIYSATIVIVLSKPGQ
jgi:hypothetical protein